MAVSVPDVERIAALMRDVAAREILPRFRRLAAADIAEKGRPSDFVTTADLEAERCLTQSLEEVVPGSVAVGEEAAEGDPGRIEALAGSAPVWLIDPVDGTGNFVRENPCFAVIVAYCVGGETRAGWILDPVDDAVVWAVAGEGAWLDQRHRRQRLAAAVPKPLAEMTGSLGSNLGRRVRARAAGGIEVGPTKLVRYGCTGREYMELARGTLDFARYQRLKPWDHAAGILIHAEAGGYSAIAEDGGPYRPQPRIRTDTVILAPDEATWHALRASFEAAMQSDLYL